MNKDAIKINQTLPLTDIHGPLTLPPPAVAAVQPQAEQPVTEEMVTAYLEANTRYWSETDAMPPTNPSKWRNGTPKEATRVSLQAALAAHIDDLTRCATSSAPEITPCYACGGAGEIDNRMADGWETYECTVCRPTSSKEASDAAQDDYAAKEREHFGDPDKGTGIYHPTNMPAETVELKAINALLWCYRRLKNNYGRLPFVEEAVAELRAAQAAQPCRDTVLTPMLLLNAAACIETPELADAKKKDSIIGKLIEASRALRTQPAQQTEPSVPAQAVTLNSAEIEQGWRDTFSTNNPFCPCDLGAFTKSVRWAERRLLSGSATGEAG